MSIEQPCLAWETYEILCACLEIGVITLVTDPSCIDVKEDTLVSNLCEKSRQRGIRTPGHGSEGHDVSTTPSAHSTRIWG